jgi:hypothetical protein
MTDSILAANEIEWFLQQFTEAAGLKEITAKPHIRRFLDSFPVTNSASITKDCSAISKMGVFGYIKTGYIPDSEGYVISTLEVNFEESGRKYTSILGYFYWNVLTEEMEYLCVGNTFKSKDGEYRNRFHLTGRFLERYRKLANGDDNLLYDVVEDHILRMISENHIEIENRVYSEDANIIDKVTNDINNLRLPIHALVYIICTGAARVQGLLAHVDRTFIAFIKFVLTQIPELRSDFHYDEFIDYGGENLICGQKLVPMTLKEVMNPFDCSMSVWRELLFNQAVSNLVINYICPCFPINGYWTYVKNVNKNLFTNKSMHKIYTRGAAAELSTKSLKAAKGHVRDYSTNHFVGEFTDTITDSIEYAQSYLLLSDICMLHVMENIGITFDNYTSLAYKLDPKTCILRTEEQCRIIMFDYIYGVHCLHSKLGVLHADLHTNNIVITDTKCRKRPLPDGTFSSAADPVTVYAIGPDESDVFVLDNLRFAGGIIDMSKSVFGPEFRPFIERETKSPQTVDNLYKDQVNRIMRLLHRWSPDFTLKHQSEIKSVLLSRYDLAFPVIACIDYISLGHNMKETLKTLETLSKEPVINPAMVKWAQKIDLMAREQLMVGLQDLVYFAKEDNVVIRPKFPGDQIIRSVFADNMIIKWEMKFPGRLDRCQLTAAYNHNNPVKFDATIPKLFPTWAQFDHIAKTIVSARPVTKYYPRGPELMMKRSGRINKFVHPTAELYKAANADSLVARPNASWL